MRRELQGREPEQRVSQPEFRQALSQELQELLREQRKRREPEQQERPSRPPWAFRQGLQAPLREQRKRQGPERRGPLQAWSTFQQWRQPSSREPSSKLP